MESKGIVIDSSAFIAFVRREPTAVKIGEVIEKCDFVFMSASSRLESCMVLGGQADFSETDMLRAQTDMAITIVPFSKDHATTAYDAFLRYGKGRHRAGLNFGDCQAYATAKLAGLPLLFVGDDFGHTDIEAVLTT
jgi:ribonuclease VapC